MKKYHAVKIGDFVIFRSCSRVLAIVKLEWTGWPILTHQEKYWQNVLTF